MLSVVQGSVSSGEEDKQKHQPRVWNHGSTTLSLESNTSSGISGIGKDLVISALDLEIHRRGALRERFSDGEKFGCWDTFETDMNISKVTGKEQTI